MLGAVQAWMVLSSSEKLVNTMALQLHERGCHLKWPSDRISQEMMDLTVKT